MSSTTAPFASFVIFSVYHGTAMSETNSLKESDKLYKLCAHKLRKGELFLWYGSPRTCHRQDTNDRRWSLRRFEPYWLWKI